VDKGTKWSDLRRKHGIADPHKVTHWCLGNEMDGPWQIGHMSAVEYGEKAADAARQMRYVDLRSKLIACGSSGPTMPTYLEWDAKFLNSATTMWMPSRCIATSITLPKPAEETPGNSWPSISAWSGRSRKLLPFANTCAAASVHQKALAVLRRMECLVPCPQRRCMDGDRKEAPHLLEEVYNLEDALLVGGLINSLLRNSDRVRVGCLAQLSTSSRRS